MPKQRVLRPLLVMLAGLGSWLPICGEEPRAAGAADAAAALCLVDKGKPLACIVIPATNNEAPRAFALLLSEYIEKSTGARIPIRAEPADSGHVEIYLGDTLYAKSRALGLEKLDADGFVLAFPEPNRMIIAGASEWGTEFGVYEFLERYLGVRWLFPGDLGEDVPTCTTLTIPAAEVRQEPAFFSRIIVGPGLYDRDTPLLGGGRKSDTQTWAFRSRQHSRIEFHHNLWSLFAPSVFGKTHPEFYPLRFAKETRDWVMNEGEGSGKVELAITREARNGQGALQVSFLPWQKEETFCGIVTKKPGLDGGWPAYGKYQGIRFWFKGDGSKATIVFSIAANSWKENYVVPLSLDNTEWRLISIPWNTLKSAETVFNPLTMHALTFGINSYLGGSVPCPGVTFCLDDLELYADSENRPLQSLYDFEKNRNDKGKRFIPDSDECKNEPWWNPCFTAEGLAEAAVTRIQDFFARNPQATSYSLGINDAGGLCECANCLARVGGKVNFLGTPNLSDLYYEWVNKVTEGVLAKYPDKYIGLLAYDSVIEPPTRIRLNPHIVPYLTYDRMKWADPTIAAEGQRLTQAWAKASPTLGWYEYIFGLSYMMPRVYFHEMAESLKFGYENGARGYFAEAWILSVPKDWIEGPKLYLTMKLLWDPYLDVDKTLRAWYESAVGKDAAPYLKAYFAYLEEFWTQRIPQSEWFKANGKAIYLNFMDPGYLNELTTADLTTCGELLKLTLAKARTEKQQLRAKMFLSTFQDWSVYTFENIQGKKMESLAKLEGEKLLSSVTEYREYLATAPRTPKTAALYLKSGLLLEKAGEKGAWAAALAACPWGQAKAAWVKPFVGSLQPAALGPRALGATPVPTPPVVDGILDDACWTMAEKAGDFKDFLSDTTVAQPTFVACAYDAQNLYVAYLMFETNPGSLVTNAKPGGRGVWDDDSVELFLQPEPESSRYYQIIVSAAGVDFHCRHEGSLRDSNWDPRYAVTAYRGDTFWTVEMAIPLAALVEGTPKPGAAWKANFNRNRPRTEQADRLKLEVSGWTFVGGSNLRPETFGTLLFR
jgi:hypothetical protein